MVRVAIVYVSRTLGLLLMLSGVGSVAAAATSVPEVDPASASSALALLAGTYLLARDKFRQVG